MPQQVTGGNTPSAAIPLKSMSCSSPSLTSTDILPHPAKVPWHSKGDGVRAITSTASANVARHATHTQVSKHAQASRAHAHLEDTLTQPAWACGQVLPQGQQANDQHSCCCHNTHDDGCGRLVPSGVALERGAVVLPNTLVALQDQAGGGVTGTECFTCGVCQLAWRGTSCCAWQDGDSTHAKSKLRVASATTIEHIVAVAAWSKPHW